MALEASGNEALREACAAVFRGWETRIAGRLMRETPGTARAERLGRAAVALVEGALLLAKTHRSTQSLKDAEALLEQILG